MMRITIIIITKYDAALQTNGLFRYHKRGFFFYAPHRTTPHHSIPVLYKLFIVFFLREEKESVFVFLCLCGVEYVLRSIERVHLQLSGWLFSRVKLMLSCLLGGNVMPCLTIQMKSPIVRHAQ